MKNLLSFLTVLTFSSTISARAEFLFDSYLIPGFDGQPDTEFSRWNVLYAPNGGQNYPDAFAPNGVYQTASAAGFSNPGDWSPLNPLAFWDINNPTIAQTNGGHFIIGPGTTGNIYSFSTPGFFTLADTTPFTLGTVVFQFQTEGTAVDVRTLKLTYDNGSGIQELAPSETLREYRSGTSSFGGFTNRNAIQWNVAGLGITSYNITFHSLGSSMSFQQALLDTSATHEAVVPEGRTWIGTNLQNWSTGTNWQQGSPSVTNGNVRFENTSATTIALDGDRTVAEFIIDTGADITINGTSRLTANTGITSTSAATGTTMINTSYELGAYNIMDVEAGTVELNGIVSGAFGMLKTGGGTLVLGNNNTFGTTTSGLGVQGGTLRIEGINTYGGATSVLFGTLEVATGAPVSSPGAIGNASTAVTVGASSSLFSGITEPAQIIIDGAHTIARNINIEQGSFEKRLGAKNTGTEAIYSGNVSLLGTGTNATSLQLFADDAADTVRFSGNITGGSATSTISINANGETGTVIFSGTNKTHASATEVLGGTLIVASGTSTTGNGAWTIADGAALQVDGIISGSGALNLQNGSTLTGSGSVDKALTIGSGSTLSPGNSPGAMNTLSQTWSAGGSYLWEINSTAGTQGSDPGWDWLNINGALDISFTNADPFSIRITSLTPANTGGLLFDFADLTSYSWTIASASGGISGFNADSFLLDTTGFQNAFTGTFGVDQSGNNLLLTYTAIPEPSSALLILLPLLGASLRRQRKKSRLP